MDHTLSDTAEAQEFKQKQRTYTVGQIGVCSFLGGPIAGGWMLSKNYAAFGDEDQSRAALMYTGLGVIALCAIIPFIPESFPSSAFPIGYCALLSAIAHKDKEKIETYTRKSHWKAFGISVAAFVILITLFGITFYAYDVLGVVKLDP